MNLFTNRFLQDYENTTFNSTDSSSNSFDSGNITNELPDGLDFIPPPELPERHFIAIAILRYEFILFMMPCYIFLVAILYRWIQMRHEPELDDFDPKFHISYYIKRFISYVMFATYMLTLILTQLLDPEYYWAADYKDYSLLYGFAALAWFLSAKSMEKEHKKDLPQKFYTHRLFWVSSFAVHMVKLFLNREHVLLIFPINFLRCFLGGFLTIYAIYKPYDSDRNARNDFSEMPPFAKDLLNWFENWETLRNYLGGSRLKEESLIQAETTDEIKNVLGQNRISGDFGQDAQEKFLKGQLPHLSIKIIKLTWNRSPDENDVKFFYITQVEVSKNGEIMKKTIHKQFRQFLELEIDVQNHFKRIYQDDLQEKIPWFKKIKIEDYDAEATFVQARIDILNGYLSSFVKSPRFIIKEVLDFLEIDEPFRTPLLNYSQYMETAEKYKKKKKVPMNLELSLMASNQDKLSNDYNPPKYEPTKEDFNNSNKLGGVNNQSSTFNQRNNFLAKIASSPLSFNVRCDYYQRALSGDRYEFVFSLTEKHSKESWKFTKSYTDFVDLHKALEARLNRGIPFFERYAVKSDNVQQSLQEDFLNKRKEGLENYLKSLLGNTIYYDPILFQFIGYNINTRKPMSNINTPRASMIEDNSADVKNQYNPNDISANKNELYKALIKKNYSAGAFKIEINLSCCSIKIPTFKNVRTGIKVGTVYEILLEEKDTIDKNRIIRQIIHYKKFREFVELYNNIARQYETKGYLIPKPPDKQGLMGKTKPEDRKGGLQRFMNDLLKLPDINTCEAFRDFFNLNDIRSNSKFPLDIETYDFRNEHEYDDIVEGEGPGMMTQMSTLLKKVDVFGIVKQ